MIIYCLKIIKIMQFFQLLRLFSLCTIIIIYVTTNNPYLAFLGNWMVFVIIIINVFPLSKFIQISKYHIPDTFCSRELHLTLYDDNTDFFLSSTYLFIFIFSTCISTIFLGIEAVLKSSWKALSTFLDLLIIICNNVVRKGVFF